ncbi:hypothetical protein H5S11_03260 [Limosilactobacillus sp. pH52_RY]|uniref:hypothetical protein n=1 Tax=Limosilactobacillus balticus TaxID=2759747 RepID=UPI0015FBE1A1|nr:hypothetical protein [Limosilactobacillus balticus]MBB1109493.1 hypothetical protein [Limosilactobacillus balticus]
MQHLTEQQEIDIYAIDKFHQLTGMVSRYLKVRAMIDYKEVHDPANIVKHVLVVNDSWQLMTPREQEEVLFFNPDWKMAKKLADRINKLEK